MFKTVAMPNYNVERNVVTCTTRTSLSLTNAGRRCHIIPDQKLRLRWNDIEKITQDHCKLVPYIYDFLLVVDSNYGRQSTAFRDLRHQTTVVLDLEMNIVYIWGRYFKSFMRLDGYRSFCIIPQLRVVQDHWKCRHSLDHIPFSTGQPLLVLLYIVPFLSY